MLNRLSIESMSEKATRTVSSNARPVKLFMVLSLLFTDFLFTQCTPLDRETEPLDVVPTVNLERYAGTWYEIARLPNTFQKRCLGNVTATYTLTNIGNIAIVNQCSIEGGELIKAEGTARIATPNEPNSKLKARFAPKFLSFLSFVWGDYWIIDLADDYSYAVIGEPKRRYLWILARQPEMDQRLFEEIVSRVRKQGYQLKHLVVQRARGNTDSVLRELNKTTAGGSQ